MRYAARTRTRAPSGMPTPKPTFNDEFDEEDGFGTALAADGGDVETGAGFEKALLRLVVDAAAG